MLRLHVPGREAVKSNRVVAPDREWKQRRRAGVSGRDGTEVQVIDEERSEKKVDGPAHAVIVSTARSDPDRANLFFNAQVVGHTKYAGDTVGTDAGHVLVRLGGDDSLQRHISVLDDDMDRGHGLQRVTA